VNTVFLFCQGLLGGVSLLHLYLTFQSKDNAFFLKVYSPSSGEVRRMFFILSVASFVGACEKLSQVETDHASWKLRSGKEKAEIVGCCVMYLCALILTLMATPVADEMHFTYAKEGDWGEQYGTGMEWYCGVIERSGKTCAEVHAYRANPNPPAGFTGTVKCTYINEDHGDAGVCPSSKFIDTSDGADTTGDPVYDDWVAMLAGWRWYVAFRFGAALLGWVLLCKDLHRDLSRGRNYKTECQELSAELATANRRFVRMCGRGMDDLNVRQLEELQRLQFVGLAQSNRMLERLHNPDSNILD